jgi:Asp-tRNA(Asn)/Glu-tRNA(Gln) amidotransferase A subunit family amidase
MPTCHNSPIYKDDGPSLVDAAPIITLRAAGALIFGKTTTTEFASTSDGSPSTNPHDSGRTPGGSSSGSGAAAGDFQVLRSFPMSSNTTDSFRCLSDLVLKLVGVQSDRALSTGSTHSK